MEAKVEAIVNRRIAKAMTKVARPEFKVYNYLLPSTGFNYDAGAAYYSPCTGIVNGSSISTRIGNEIRPQKLKWQFTFTAGDNSNVVRFLIVRSKNVASVPTSASTMSANIMGGITGGSQVHGAVDVTAWDVLHDEYFETHYAPVDGSTSATVAIPVTSKGSVDLGNCIVRYTQQASTVLTGRLPVMLFLSDSAIAPNPAVVGVYGIEWHDA